MTHAWGKKKKKKIGEEMIKHTAHWAQWACSTERIPAAAGSGPLISPAGAGGGHEATPAVSEQATRAE